MVTLCSINRSLGGGGDAADWSVGQGAEPPDHGAEGERSQWTQQQKEVGCYRFDYVIIIHIFCTIVPPTTKTLTTSCVYFRSSLSRRLSLVAHFAPLISGCGDHTHFLDSAPVLEVSWNDVAIHVLHQQVGCVSVCVFCLSNIVYDINKTVRVFV